MNGSVANSILTVSSEYCTMHCTALMILYLPTKISDSFASEHSSEWKVRNLWVLDFGFASNAGHCWPASSPFQQKTRILHSATDYTENVQFYRTLHNQNIYISERVNKSSFIDRKQWMVTWKAGINLLRSDTRPGSMAMPNLIFAWFSTLNESDYR